MMRFFLLLALSYLYVQAAAQIFVYHRFGDDAHPTTNTTINQLKAQFDYFKNNNYKVVKLQSIVDKLKNKQSIPDNWVALTIDDSYKSFYENGLPLFKEYNYPFTLFVYVKATQENYGDFMSWEQLKETAKYGSLQLHSYAHHHLTHKSLEITKKDTIKAKEIFTQALGFEPNIYAYPYGEFNDDVKKTIKDLGFEAIVNQNYGSVTAKSDIYDINRIALVGEVNLKEKLRYQSFEAEWIEPNGYPKDDILKRIEVRVDKKIKKLKLYVTGHGWRDINVNDGIISENLNLELTNPRTRVILSPDYYTVSNKLIIK